jgi:hypothetical protein
MPNGYRPRAMDDGEHVVLGLAETFTPCLLIDPVKAAHHLG